MKEQEHTKLRILIADDDNTNRLVLNAILKKNDYEVFSAENGKVAVDLYEQMQPDIVLMDVMMPVMDGYEATRRIKELCGEKFVPVIFLTAMTDEKALAKCIESGGDDFLTKPYNQTLLHSKINALLRILGLYNKLDGQKHELTILHEHIRKEHEVAKRLFSNITHPGCLNASYFKYHASPMAIFNGDLIIAAHKPSGGLHVMVGDFTGHGLPAAVGALPASDIFYSMTSRGYAISDIIKELNNKLRQVLTTGLFFAVCILEINLNNRSISSWNGGIPSCFIRRGQNGDLVQIKSSNLPLGIVDTARLNSACEITEIETGDRIYMSTDGVVEALNEQGEMFGDDRYMAILRQPKDERQIFEEIMGTLKEFSGDREQSDDVTFIEIHCAPELNDADLTQMNKKFITRTPAKWRFHLSLDSEALRICDPLPFIMQPLTEIQGLHEFRSKLFTIISELFSNALDHGILGLNSKTKATPDGFMKYYQQREERLSALTDDWIRVTISNKPVEKGGELTIHIEDSGPGFDYTKSGETLEANQGFSGRGIPLVRNLCKELNYKGSGNEVIALFQWNHQS